MFQYIDFSATTMKYLMVDSEFSEQLDPNNNYFAMDVINIYERKQLLVLDALTTFYTHISSTVDEPFFEGPRWNDTLALPAISLSTIKNDFEIFNLENPNNKFKKYYCQLIHRFTKFRQIYGSCDNFGIIGTLYNNRLRAMLLKE